METIAFICVITLLFKGVVTDESVSLMMGDSVTLHTNLTNILSDGLIEWRFGDQWDLLARINGVAKISINDTVIDGRFSGRLKLNTKTGDLTITNITTQHTGDYQLDISGRKIMRKIFIVDVSDDKEKNVTVGDSVILHNNVTKKPGDEKIVWRIQHNNSPVAKIIRNGKETNDDVHERYRGRLQVNDQTGDLIITNITSDDSGSYEVNITVGSHIYTIYRSFNVPVKVVDPQKDHLKRNVTQGLVTAGAICGVVLGVAAVVAAGFFIHRKCPRTNGGRVIRDEII